LNSDASGDGWGGAGGGDSGEESSACAWLMAFFIAVGPMSTD